MNDFSSANPTQTLPVITASACLRRGFKPIPEHRTTRCSATIWMESSDNQDGHFGGRGEVMIVAARR